MGILDVILNASEKDLAELDAMIAEHVKQLDAMKSARKVIADRLGVEGPKRGPQKRDPSEKSEREASPLANQIYDLLAKEGSLPLNVIASRLRTLPQGVARAITGTACAKWFTRSPDGDISIAKGPD